LIAAEKVIRSMAALCPRRASILEIDIRVHGRDQYSQLARDMRNLFYLLVATTLAGIGSATAQNYPSRPITIVVPFAPGGATDVIGRTMADRMRTLLRQPVIIENVTGAAGSIGAGRVARAQPDGYMLDVGQWSTHVTNGAIYALPYDLLKDFEPVALLASQPYLISAKKTLPPNDLNALIAWLRANPDKALAGTAGGGR
jgi:tripartite-type tricarboxylate transporter receptor subunit TctC